MISYFPPIYPDELLYSQLARYYVKSGHIAYCYAAKDLYLNPSIRPNEDSLNTFTEDALKRITQYEPLESIVERHTMFPLYGRFLPKERRNILFKSFVSMSNHCKNYLPIKNKGSRYLRYCPICVVKDREQYGETYWHRIHQLQGLNVCPTHHSKLINSNYIIDGNNSPTLIAAENLFLRLLRKFHMQ